MHHALAAVQKERPAMPENPVEQCARYFEAGFCCAESVLLALAEAQDIHSPLIPRIATAFCAGMARTSRTCGAVSGAIMGLNLAFGRDDPSQSKETLYEVVQTFLRQFEERFGSTECRVLTGIDMNTEQGRQQFQAQDMRATCAAFPAGATEIALALCAKQDTAQSPG
jgi:C_GCAxxG_C_C family probable redox protein